MRFLKYLSYSGLDENTNKFRILRINLVNDNTCYKDIIQETCKKYDIDSNKIYGILNSLNDDFKNIYKGKFRFEFCLEEGTTIDNIKINKKYVKRFKIMLFEANNKLAKIKKCVEKII